MDLRQSMEWTSISSEWSEDPRYSKERQVLSQASDDRKTRIRKYVMFFGLAYGNFWASACVSLQAPFFPEKAEQKGVSAAVYGLIFGIYELAILLTAPLFGKLIGKVSSKYLINSGLFLIGSSNILFGYFKRISIVQAKLLLTSQWLLDLVSSRNDFIILAFAIRIVEGIGAAAFLTASYTLMASEFPDKVAVYFALLETCFGLGLILGPTVGGVLYQLGNYHLPFVVAGGFMITGSIVGLIVISETHLTSTNKSGQWLRFLCDFGLILDMLSIISALSFIGFNCATLEPHLRPFDLSPSVTGSVFIITGTIYAITSPLWGKLIEKGVDPKKICAFGAFISGVGVMFIGPLPNLFETKLWLVICSLVLIGFGVAAKLVAGFMDALNDSVNRRNFPNDTSTYGMCSAMYFCCSSIGAFAGPSLGGVLIDKFGYRCATIFVFVFEIFLLFAILVYIIRNKNSNVVVNNERNEKRPLLARRSSELANCCVSHL